MSVRRYQQAQETFDDPRLVEHRMLTRVTGMLIDGGKKGGRTLIEACYYNRKLWTIFQTDLAHPDNKLPESVRANLISLSLWVQRYTGEVLDGAPVEPLIDVNRSIMDGLKPQANGERPAPVRIPAAPV
jgi:flagellar biosynthesis activator protein FlaF